MWKRVLKACHHLKAVSIRRSARLEVLSLEMRVTPALTPEGLALPVPQVVQVGPIVPQSHEANVRTDLFGAGVVQHTDDAETQECFARTADAPSPVVAPPVVVNVDAVEVEEPSEPDA